MSIIKNKKQLLINPRNELNRKVRSILLDSIEETLEGIDPEKLIQEKVKVKNGRLIVEGLYRKIVLDLSKFSKIFLLGAGKASVKMAIGLENILGDKVTGGAIIKPDNLEVKAKPVKVNVLDGTHPIPSHKTLTSSQHLLSYKEKCDEQTLIIFLLSGGASSLLEIPIENLSLEEYNQFIKEAMKTGMNIRELNIVRKHLSKVKGGKLVRIFNPATILTIAMSDVKEDKIDTIGSGPTVPDNSTYHDAIEILKKYGIWESAPVKIKQILTMGLQGQLPETIKADEIDQNKVKWAIIANNFTATRLLKEALEKRGINAYILSANLEGEARIVGEFISRIARDQHLFIPISKKPLALIFGGETTVTVKGNGFGGRNQEVVLSSLENISGLHGVAILSVGTDGVDGNSEAAGAIADGESYERSVELGLQPKKYLERNDSYTFFKLLNDAIITGFTGTNLNDIMVVLVLG